MGEALRTHTLDVVTACRAADLGVLRIALDSLRRLVSVRQFYVYTARLNFARFRRALGSDVNLIDQDEAIREMPLAALKKLRLPGFPQGAGWYFQQLLKYSFCYSQPADDHYLIWDADTIPLRPMEFFDAKGRMLFTIAEEEHASYFNSYRTLLGEEPRREFSFIAQHMIVQKSILREMLRRIEARFPGDESWAWKIMRNLDGGDTNLFSEYEMLGHFAKNHFPERFSSRRLSWLREGSRRVTGLPRPADLEALAREYHFAAFESGQRPLRSAVRNLRAWWKMSGGQNRV